MVTVMHLVNENYNVSGCFELALIDAGSYWDSASVTVSVNGVDQGSYANTSASGASQEERFEVCVSGAAVLNHVCTSTYDCPNMTIRVYLAGDRWDL